MRMNAKQRSAADFLAKYVNSINELLKDPSSVSQQDLNHWGAVVDQLTRLAEVDYANCNSDAQRMAVTAVLIAALALRVELRGTPSKPLSDLYDLLINGALGKPTRLQLPAKRPGATKPINADQAAVYYAVLYARFPDQQEELNAAARKRFGLNNGQLSRKRYDLKRQRAEDTVFERMFSHAEREISEMKSHNLNDYI
jgi:hypothetical protein